MAHKKSSRRYPGKARPKLEASAPLKPIRRAKARPPTRTPLKVLLALSPKARALLPPADRERLERHASGALLRMAQWTTVTKAKFLRVFCKVGIVGVAAKTAGCGRRTVYDWLRDDPDFAELYRESYENALDAMEGEAHRRGVEGYERPVFQGGKEVGRVQEYSDLLLITLLKGKRPETFRERYEHSGPGGAPLPSPQVNNVSIYMPENGRPRRVPALPDIERQSK